MTPEDAAVGCVLGTAVGDALGLACEGLSAVCQERRFPSLDGYHMLFGKGLCSDDTEHTCMIAQSILVSGGDASAFERDFAWRLRWWFAGLPAGCAFHAIRPAVPAAFVHCFARDPPGDSTVMRPGQSERSDAGVALLRGGGRVGQRPGPAFAQRLAFEGDAVGAVDQAIEDGVGECRVADDVVPVLDR